MKFLVENGASMNTLPRACIRCRQLDALKFLIGKQANINEISESHPSALFVAVAMNLIDFVKVLVENNADLTLTYQGVYFLFRILSSTMLLRQRK